MRSICDCRVLTMHKPLFNLRTRLGCDSANLSAYRHHQRLRKLCGCGSSGGPRVAPGGKVLVNRVQPARRPRQLSEILVGPLHLT